jgi:hypothetical protein
MVPAKGNWNIQFSLQRLDMPLAFSSWDDRRKRGTKFIEKGLSEQSLHVTVILNW